MDGHAVLRNLLPDLLIQGHWRQLYTCLVRDRCEVGTLVTLRWLGRRGLVPLLPEGSDAVSAAGRNNKAEDRMAIAGDVPTIGGATAYRSRVQPGAAATPVPGAQLQILEGAYDVAAREAEEHQMALAGIELRAPFHDQRMIEFAFASPVHLRLRGRTTKWLHRHALRDSCRLAFSSEALRRISWSCFNTTLTPSSPNCRNLLGAGGVG